MEKKFILCICRRSLAKPSCRGAGIAWLNCWNIRTPCRKRQAFCPARMLCANSSRLCSLTSKPLSVAALLIIRSKVSQSLRCTRELGGRLYKCSSREIVSEMPLDGRQNLGQRNSRSCTLSRFEPGYTGKCTATIYHGGHGGVVQGKYGNESG